MRSRIFRPIALSLCCIAAPLTALAQAPAQPVQPVAPAQPAPEQPAAPAQQPAQPVSPPVTEPSAAPTAPPTEPVAPPAAPPAPPTYPGAGPVGEPPPPPTYQPLGGKPEPEIEKGDWDPWDHPTADTHNHDGFFLRLAVGVGGSFVSGNNSDFVGDIDLSGFGFGTSLAIGGAVVDNLIINADFFHTTLFDGSVSQDGHDVGDASDVGHDLGVGEDVQMAGLGIGVTYYIMPVNLYLAGSIGIGEAEFEDNSGDRDGSDLGFAANVMVGKEWWVGSDWGIGVAGQMLLLSVGDDVLNHVNGLGLTLMFSATYN